MGSILEKNVPPLERELKNLLADLCVKWGFCIPPDDQDKIAKKDQYQAIEFAKDVVDAEGMEGNSEWVNRIVERFKERFGTNEIDSLTFVDRVRGIKENW